MRNPTLAVALWVFFFAGSGFTSAGPTYRSSANDYSVTFPDGWVQIPQDELNQMYSRLRSSQGVAYQWETAYQSQAGPPWFNYPYVILQVVNYPGGGQPSEQELAQVVKAQSGLDINKAIHDSGSDVARELVSGASQGISSWNEDTHTLRQTLQINVQGIGPIEAKTTGHFGRRALVSVMCYSSASSAQANQPAFAQINNSFQFDPGAGYDARLGNAARMGRKVGQLVVAVVGIGVVILAVILVVRLASGGKRPGPPPLYPPR